MGIKVYDDIREVAEMDELQIRQRISDIEREIARLPEGSISKKRINDKEYYYHRITRNGKRTEKIRCIIQ